MVELTFNTVLRRYAAVLRKQQGVSRCLSFSKSSTNVRQSYQKAKQKDGVGEHTRTTSEGAADYSDARSSESTEVRETAVVFKAESEKRTQIRAEGLRHEVTHIIGNGEDIDRLEEGIARRLPNVEVLYLFDNRLSDAVGLGLWPRLRRVYLQNNLISSLRGALDNLPFLEELNVDSNHIEILEGLTACSRLTRLSLANQKTAKPLRFDDASLRALSKSLRFLNISGNRVEDLRSIAVLELLESLDAAANDVLRLDVIGVVLAECRKLQTMNLCNNPVSRAPYLRQYLRYILLHASDELCELDGKKVTNVQRTFIQNMHRHLSGPQRQRSQEAEV